MLEHGSIRFTLEGTDESLEDDIDRSKPLLFPRSTTVTSRSTDGKRKGEKGGGRFEKEGKKEGKGFAEDIEEDIGRRPVWP